MTDSVTDARICHFRLGGDPGAGEVAERLEFVAHGDAGLPEMFQGRFEVAGADVQPKVRVERWARAHTDLFAIR
jgi:hypothetical protein